MANSSGAIGPTGSGKSTLLGLLLRFYDPDDGEIRIAGQNLREIEPALLHSAFGVVFQNDFLFDRIYHYSITSISVGKPTTLSLNVFIISSFNATPCATCQR